MPVKGSEAAIRNAARQATIESARLESREIPVDLPISDKVKSLLRALGRPQPDD
jgi:hypothetical protein